MSAALRVMIALGLVLVLIIGLVILGVVATRSVEEKSEPPLEPAGSGSSVERGISEVEEGISKAQQKVKEAEQEVKEAEQKVEAQTETKSSKLSKEVQEACDKAKLDLITGTAKGELDKDQRATLEGVIARQCE